MKIANNRNEDADARRSALKNLLRQATPKLLPHLKKLTTDKVLSTEAIRGLALYNDPEIPGKVLNFFDRDPVNRSVAIDTLVSRKSYATVLLAAVAKGRVPSRAISPFQARQIQSLGDKGLNQKLSEQWGIIRATSDAKKAEIAAWKAKLTSEKLSSADPAKGKQVFSRSCAACHKLYGEGGNFGPDLTGSDRHNLDYLLGNTIDPSDVVPADYRLTVFTLKDGRVISGIVPEETERTVTVQGPSERQTFEKSQIEKRQSLPTSLMPEGLLGALDEADVSHLIAYLMSKKK